MVYQNFATIFIDQLTYTFQNLTYSLRRARLESQPTKLPTNTNNKKSVTHDTRGKSETITSISRTDSGRFSMRSNRTSNTVCNTFFFKRIKHS